MRRLIASFGIVILSLFLVLGYAYWRFNQCRLTVTNLSGHDIHQVAALVTNGPSADIGTIENGRSKTVRVYPRGESGMQISFTGQGGRTVKGGSAYIEPQGYHERWVVGPGDKVLCTSSEIEAL